MEQSYSQCSFKLFSEGRGRGEGQWWSGSGVGSWGWWVYPTKPCSAATEGLIFNQRAVIYVARRLNKSGTAPWKTWWECRVSFKPPTLSNDLVEPEGCSSCPGLKLWVLTGAGWYQHHRLFPTRAPANVINVPNKKKTNGFFFFF